MAKAQMPRISTQAVSGPARIQKARVGKSGEVVWVINMKTWDTGANDYAVVPEFRIPVGQAPAYLKPGDWNLRVASDKTKILSGLPDAAVLTCEFLGFLHAENQPPAPTVKGSRFDASKPWVQFGIQYKVVEGDFKDIIVTEYLNYNFGFVEQNGKKVAAYKPATGKSTEALSQRIDALRVLEFGLIPWKGEPITWQVGGTTVDTGLVNILPNLEQRARKAVEELNARLQVSIVGGKVAAVKPALGEDEEIWDDEDTPETIGGEDTPTSTTVPDDDDINWDDEEV